MSTGTSRLVCAGCGWEPGPLAVDPYPFRCPNAGLDDVDHVVRCAFSLKAGSPTDAQTDNPFIRYRSSLYSWNVALSHGISDADYVSIVKDIDASIAGVGGCGFHETPFGRSSNLSAALGLDASGGVWVKDETNNVSGSHKARHLMGVALYLEVVARVLGRGTLGSYARCPLAVASCGNAALAAAVVARAVDRQLLVFVPEHAASRIVAQLEQLGADVTRCTRDAAKLPGSGAEAPRAGAGDPCYHAFRRAVASGGVPFSCQGSENGLVIQGGATLAFEMCDELAREGIDALDRVFIQVGGGALASACVQAFEHCVACGRLASMPRVHAVQTCGGYPLKRAYDLVVHRLLAEMPAGAPGARLDFSTNAERARHIQRTAPAPLLDRVFAYARGHRSEFMWPWESEPRSVAGGILDDETYDWAVVVEAMVRSGGFPIVVDEATLEEANAVGRRATGVNVDHTGSAGFAGLLALSRSPDRPEPSERIAVLFTGVRR